MKQVIPGLQTFEFITNSLRRLELAGTLLSWSDKHLPGLAEHQVLKRRGAIHQDVGSRPSKYSFRCTFLGEGAGDKYKTLVAAVDEDPTGKIIHPRFGSVAVACEGIQAQEDPENAVGEITFQIDFVETGLRKEPKESAGSIAGQAIEATTPFQGGLPVSYSTYGAALQLAVVSTANQVGALVTAGQDAVAAVELARTTGDVFAACDGVQRVAKQRGDYSVYASAALVRSKTIESYNAAITNRPPVISYLVPGDISLSRLCAALYGGKIARSLAQEISLLNRLTTPQLIPGGTVLQIPDPDVVGRGK